jgi:hypothetical protein
MAGEQIQTSQYAEIFFSLICGLSAQLSRALAPSFGDVTSCANVEANAEIAPLPTVEMPLEYA